MENYYFQSFYQTLPNSFNCSHFSRFFSYNPYVVLVKLFQNHISMMWYGTEALKLTNLRLTSRKAHMLVDVAYSFSNKTSWHLLREEPFPLLKLPLHWNEHRFFRMHVSDKGITVTRNKRYNISFPGIFLNNKF